METSVYYMAEIKMETVTFSTWISYRGEHTGIDDWWNYSPIHYRSETEALSAIRGSRFCDCDWRIIKVITTTETVVENFSH